MENFSFFKVVINIEFFKNYSLPRIGKFIDSRSNFERSKPASTNPFSKFSKTKLNRIDIFFFFTANMKNRRCFGNGFAEQERVPAKNSAYWWRVETTPADENYRKIDGVTCVSVSVKVHATTHPTRLEIDAVSESCLLALPRVFQAVIIAPSAIRRFSRMNYSSNRYFFFTILEIKLRFVNLSF